MGKSKDKGTKKPKGSGSSAAPEFEFDLDFEDSGAPRNILDDHSHDDDSVSTSASQNMMKTVKKALIRQSSQRPGPNKSMDLDNRSNHSTLKKKKSVQNLSSNLD